ncbi:GldL-related protein [Flavobacterium facile]|uniref:GldL-related protein n=1 Tax=Flavobacterium facile TaxID=2893174 RepID=UPI002E781DBA|nr:hypothetical protein [Flavobacterium sp. T-12]
MKSQYKIPLVLFLLGMLLTIVGALFKIMHWPFASMLLISGTLSEAIAIISIIVIVLKKN